MWPAGRSLPMPGLYHMFGKHQSQHITKKHTHHCQEWWWQHPTQWILLSNRENINAEMCQQTLTIIWLRLQQNYNLGVRFIFKTNQGWQALNIRYTGMVQRQHSRARSSPCQIKVQVQTQWRICSWTCTELFTPDPGATWQNMGWAWAVFQGRMEKKLEYPDVPACGVFL